MPENSKHSEGYIYSSYGELKYLKHAVASIQTLRRYDRTRPVALYCSELHKKTLENHSLDTLFDSIILLPEEHRSITGFKHSIYKFRPFERNLYMDSDIIWCRDPDRLWQSLSLYEFTVTGNHIADSFFGGPKGIGIVMDVMFRKRRRTLKRFGITYLNRVQTGMIYSSDHQKTRQICKMASDILEKREHTHFRSRKNERGRNQETCEWSFAVAMAKLESPIFPWRNGYESPQLDFLENYTTYTNNFRNVKCKLYNDRFVYDFKATRPDWLRKLLIGAFSLLPGKADYMTVTPYCLHFGWIHQKEPFYRYADKVWEEMTG